MLHEASTFSKAIAKAWDESGQPSEFSIKILETEKKGFLWFSKRSAIVSISYDPKKQTKRKIEKNKERRVQTHHQKRSPVPYHTSNKNKQPNRDQKEYRDQKQKPYPKRDIEKSVNTWTSEWENNIDFNLKNILSIINIKTKFTTRIDKKTLHIMFEEKLLPSSEEERMLFISLSYLLVQFLKKKFKKKLRGFHLVLKSKRSSNNDNERSS